MDIKILGPGCKNCANLEQRTIEALGSLGIDTSIDKVTDMAQIAGYGVMRTPALVIDDQVVVSGRVPSTSTIESLIAEHRDA